MGKKPWKMEKLLRSRENAFVMPRIEADSQLWSHQQQIPRSLGMTEDGLLAGARLVSTVVVSTRFFLAPALSFSIRILRSCRSRARFQLSVLPRGRSPGRTRDRRRRG